jgi:hypothetical protein
MVREPMSDVMKEAIEACRDGKTLVRRPAFRGCWTTPDAVMTNGKPAWSVTDTTVHSLIKRGLLVVTHTRTEGRPAAARLATVDEMVALWPADMQPMMRDMKIVFDEILRRMKQETPEDRRRLHLLNFPERSEDGEACPSTTSAA